MVTLVCKWHVTDSFTQISFQSKFIEDYRMVELLIHRTKTSFFNRLRSTLSCRKYRGILSPSSSLGANFLLYTSHILNQNFQFLFVYHNYQVHYWSIERRRRSKLFPQEDRNSVWTNTGYYSLEHWATPGVNSISMDFYSFFLVEVFLLITRVVKSNFILIHWHGNVCVEIEISNNLRK